MKPQQGVPVYDPQAAAMHTLPLAAHLSSTARGSRLNPDVGSGNNGNCTANGPSPTLNGKSIDRAETIWESEARNSQ